MFERDDLDLSNIIEESLEEIQSGKSSLEDVLKRHPDLSAIIRPELEVAMWLTESEAEVAPRPSFIRASRKRLVERVRLESAGLNKKRGIFGLALPSFHWQPVAAFVMAAVLIFGVAGLLNAAHDTIPGQSLYAVKRIHEQVQFGVTFSETARVLLTTEFSEHRLEEIKALLAQGDSAAAADLFDDFQLEVTRTVNLLNSVNANQPEAKLEAAQTVQAELLKQAQQLQAISEDAPEEIAAGLEMAHRVALQGAMIAVEVGDEVIRSTATPFPTTAVPSATKTVPSTSTAVPPTYTAPPQETPVPGVNPGESTPPGVPQIGTPTKEPKPTNTPRPTNENRPTERPTNENRPTERPKEVPTEKPKEVPTDKPPNENKPPDKPPNENKPTDKPPNENKPPDTEKPTKEPKPTKDK